MRLDVLEFQEQAKGNNKGGQVIGVEGQRDWKLGASQYIGFWKHEAAKRCKHWVSAI
jgi:hypothetical protein